MTISRRLPKIISWLCTSNYLIRASCDRPSIPTQTQDHIMLSFWKCVDFSRCVNVNDVSQNWNSEQSSFKRCMKSAPFQHCDVCSYYQSAVGSCSCFSVCRVEPFYLYLPTLTLTLTLNASVSGSNIPSAEPKKWVFWKWSPWHEKCDLALSTTILSALKCCITLR